MYAEIKSRLYSILEQKDGKDPAGKAFNIFLIVLIILNVLAIMLDSMEDIAHQYSSLLYAFEVFSVAVFTIEYAARLWVCNLDERYSGAITGRLRYIVSPMAVIDLLAILPFYLPMFLPFELRELRLVRLFRLFRLFKLARYNESLELMERVIVNRKEDLSVTVFVGVVILILASSAMFYAEHDAQPDKFSSIPVTMYYGVITLATIGYGDVYPVTVLGKLFSAVIAITGIGMFAMPAGIISSGFIEELQKKHEEKNVCPHCGKDINKPPSGPLKYDEALAAKILEVPPIKQK